jgi:hypothetical protein
MAATTDLDAPARAGLVTCAKTGRETTVQADTDLYALLEAPRKSFPTRADVRRAVQEFPVIDSWDGHEGPRPRVEVGPGVVRVSYRDLARRERTAERAVGARQKKADMLAARLLADGKLPDRPAPSREITGWSRKSRSNMLLAIMELDFAPMMVAGRPPAMVTLTYPGDWLEVAPNGKRAKEHLQEFRHRWFRAWGERPYAVWKLEFQHRGAPHFHLLMVPPHGRARGRGVGAGLIFKHWLSVVWADIVDHPDPVQHMNHLAAGTNVDFAEGMRYADPKRAGVYFGKHGSFSRKEYQHCVPVQWQGAGDGPGRFWGYWNLQRIAQGVEVDGPTATWAARLLRRRSRAAQTMREIRVARVPGGRPIPAEWEVVGLSGAQLLASRSGRAARRKVRRRVERIGSRGAGWLMVNNGPRFAAQIATYIRRHVETFSIAVRTSVPAPQFAYRP